jgi:hypothetical protein
VRFCLIECFNYNSGRYPIDIDIKVRTISFWAKLISGKQTKLSAIIYKCMYNMLRVRDGNFNNKIGFIILSNKSNWH